MLIIGFDLYLTEPGKYKGIKGVGKIPIDKLNKLMDEIDRTPNRAKRLFDPNESEIVKGKEWESFHHVHKSLGINDFPTPSKTRESWRNWRSRIYAKLREMGRTGNGAQPSLKPHSQRYLNILDSVNGIAHGVKVRIN